VRRVLQDDAHADALEAEPVESYATRKRVVITDNPQPRRKVNVATNGNDDLTKPELQDCIDDATDVLQDAYTPEASREELAEAVGRALDILSGDYDDEEEDDAASDDDDGR